MLVTLRGEWIVTVCSLFWHDDDDDFIFFLALKQRWHLHIQMEFTTTEHSGLLLFNGRYDGKHDFIAVEVWQGQVWFRFSLFSHEVIVTSNVNGGVIDGNWHKVEVTLQNRVRIFFEKKFAIWSPFYLYICTWMWITFYFIKNLLYHVSLLFS